MKIAFLGNFSETFTTEYHHLQTYRKLGHEVFPLQEGTDSISQILARASKADLFIWTHTHGKNMRDMDMVLDALKALDIPTASYHLDLWMGLQRQVDIQSDPYWKVDYFFTVDKLMAEFMNEVDKLPKGFYLPAGVYEDECYIADYNEKYKHDVIFVGSKIYHPEHPYRGHLIDWLAAKYGKRFAHYGHRMGQIRGDELNSLYANSKVVIGDTLCTNFNYPYYLSDRVFETTGRGGFIIHPYIKGLEELFQLQIKKGGAYNTELAEIITYEYGDFDYLEYLIDYYLENEKEREVIRVRGHKKTKSVHTYTSRLAYMLEVIQAEHEMDTQGSKI